MVARIPLSVTSDEPLESNQNMVFLALKVLFDRITLPEMETSGKIPVARVNKPVARASIVAREEEIYACRADIRTTYV